MNCNTTVEWTQEDIEERLREELEEKGLLLLPQPKRKKKGEEAEEENKYFVWPRGGKIKVKVRAAISPRALRAATPDPGVTTEPVVDDVPLDTTMLPDGANVDALEAAVKQRRLSKNESREPPKPSGPKKRGAGR